MITLAEVNDDSNAYLVEVEDEKELEEWLALNGDILFEGVLNDWYTDPDLWPQDRWRALSVTPFAVQRSRRPVARR